MFKPFFLPNNLFFLYFVIFLHLWMHSADRIYPTNRWTSLPSFILYYNLIMQSLFIFFT